MVAVRMGWEAVDGELIWLDGREKGAPFGPLGSLVFQIHGRRARGRLPSVHPRRRLSCLEQLLRSSSASRTDSSPIQPALHPPWHSHYSWTIRPSSSSRSSSPSPCSSDPESSPPNRLLIRSYSQSRANQVRYAKRAEVQCIGIGAEIRRSFLRAG